MTGSIFSPDYLENNEFVDNSSGSITPADMRDLCESSAGQFGTIQTANYTLVLADRGTLVDLNSATAVTVTVPANSSVAFPVGTIISVCQYGAGAVTLQGAASVTLRTATGSLVTRAQYSVVSLRQRAANEWVVYGDLA